MAERRGGNQRPRDRTPTAPRVGRSSQRTDRQLIATSNVQEGTDLQQGDQQRIRQLQRMNRLPAKPAPTVQQGQTQNPPRAPGGAPGGGLPPDHLMGLPSTRPGEPITEGLDFGPGAGSEMFAPPPEDDREVVLRWLADVARNQDAAEMLNEIRAGREQQAPDLPQQATGQTPEQAPPEEDEGLELLLGEEEPTEGELPEEELAPGEEIEGEPTASPVTPEGEETEV